MVVSILAPRALSARSVTKLRALDSGLCISSLLVLLSGCSKPDAMLIELPLQRLITVSPGSSSAEIRSSYLLKRRDAKHFHSFMARGQLHLPQRSSASCPLRLCCLLYALIGFFSRLPMTSRASTSAMAGMHPTRPPRDGLELVRFGSSRFSNSVLLPGFGADSGP